MKTVMLIAVLSLTPGFAQFTYTGCANVQASEFDVVSLVSNQVDANTREPIKLAFDTDAQGNVDVYFTQRYGMVRRYNGATGTVTTLLNLAYGADSVDATNSEGLIGIALDPAFDVNRWIYLFIGIEGTWRITRVTLVGNQISRASERVILSIPTGTSRKHVAGPLRFDQDGNLWIAVADNESRFTAANTNSYLGKILRIRPRPFADNQTPNPGRGSTYDVPAGNLFAAGTANTLPEIYVMGARNPYSLSLDPVRRAVTWGDVGPDNFSGGSVNPAEFTEEHNFTTQPGNFGWPYWAGNNIQLEAGGGTPQNPVNTRSDNNGLTSLPPARPALHPYARAAAIAGPVYYYNGASNSQIKFPPHFNGAWFIAEFNRSYIDAYALNTNGSQILGTFRLAVAGAGGFLNNPLDMDFGPDGALYVVNYSGYRTFDGRSGILRIEYAGNCRPVTALASGMSGKEIQFNGRILNLIAPGTYSLEIRDPLGRLEWSGIGKGGDMQDLRSFRKSGLHILTVSGPALKFAAKFVR